MFGDMFEVIRSEVLAVDFKVYFLLQEKKKDFVLLNVMVTIIFHSKGSVQDLKSGKLSVSICFIFYIIKYQGHYLIILQSNRSYCTLQDNCNKVLNCVDGYISFH